MKLSVFALSGLLALAVAQNGDDNSSSTTSTSTKTATLSPQASCAAKNCEPSDVCCLARCFEVPCPSEAMANDTTECAANCKQGDGSPKDTEEYARCQQSCFSSLFFPATATQDSSDNGPTGTRTSGSGSDATETGGSDSNSDSNSDSDSSEDSDSASSTEESDSEESGDAASTLGIKAGTAGIVGAIVAALAL